MTAGKKPDRIGLSGFPAPCKSNASPDSCGYVHSADTGLYYLQSRYYNPTIGRFINADVYTSTGQGILGNNMFAYCRNNPVCRKDISGREDVECTDLDGNEFTDDEDFIGGGGTSTGAPVGSNTGGGGGNSSTGTPGGGSSNPGTPGGGQSNGGGNNGGGNGYGFASENALIEHYAKHNADFGNSFSSPQEYLDAANYVIENGEYVSSQNAYVLFYGMGGRANYAFVGMNRDHTHITTFHLKHVSKICFG